MNCLGTKPISTEVPVLKSVGQLKGSGASIGKIAFSPDGKLVAIGDANGRLTVSYISPSYTSGKLTNILS